MCTGDIPRPIGSLPFFSLWEGWPPSAVLELHGKKGQELTERDVLHGEIPTLNGGFYLEDSSMNQGFSMIFHS